MSSRKAVRQLKGAWKGLAHRSSESGHSLPCLSLHGLLSPFCPCSFISCPSSLPFLSLPFLTSSPLPLSFPFLLHPSEVLVPWELVLLLRGSWAPDGRGESEKLEGGHEMLTLWFLLQPLPCG